jgi:hypothetical protein
MLAASDHGFCIAEPVQTFTDATFIGHIQAFNGCGGTASRIVQVAADPSDNSFTAVVLVQLTGLPDDAATLNGVLLSLGRHVPPPDGLTLRHHVSCGIRHRRQLGSS